MQRSLAVLLVGVIALAAVPVPGIAAGSAAQSSVDCEYPYSSTDVTGTEITLDSAPERVVALQASDAQTMWEIGARDQVVGLPQNQYTGYLNETEGRTDVANDDGTTNVEAVVGAESDLVLAANATSVETVQQLRDAGLTVYHFELAESIDDIANQTAEIGRLTGNCEGANDTVTDMQDRVERVENAIADEDSQRVLYYLFDFTTGNATHIHDVIETAGGENIAADAGLSGYAPLSEEIVADRDPEWIVYPSDAQEPSGSPYDETTALTEGQTLQVNSNYISQPAPRVVTVLETMAEAFHPEAFEESSPTPTPTEQGTDATETEQANDTTDTETATDAAAENEMADDATETTPGDGAGFGIVASMVALVATLVVARRKGT